MHVCVLHQCTILGLHLLFIIRSFFLIGVVRCMVGIIGLRFIQGHFIEHQLDPIAAFGDGMLDHVSVVSDHVLQGVDELRPRHRVAYPDHGS